MSEMQTFDEQVKGIIAAAVAGHEVGLGVVPSEFPKDSYVILEPGVKRQPMGDMGSLTSNRDIVYNVKCYGDDYWQVRWLEDRIEPAMLSAVDALGVQWVLPESTTGVQQDGTALYSSTSTFCIRK